MKQKKRRRRKQQKRRYFPIVLASMALLAAMAVCALAFAFKPERQEQSAKETQSAMQSQENQPQKEQPAAETEPDNAYSQEGSLATEEEDDILSIRTEEPSGSLQPEEFTGDGAPSSGRAESTLAAMTLHEKVCQLFIVYPSSITGVSRVTAAGETTKKALEKYPVGGFLYDKTNLVSKEQTRTMLDNTQSYAKIPMIFTCDEEGGRVNRLMDTVGTTYIGPMLSYKDQGAGKAEENARIIAADLIGCGFNMDLAPVADVWSNPDNTVIGDRAYSDSFQQASLLVAAAVKGFHDGGVACTLKHFPGHGDTSADSHYGSVYINKTLDQIRQEELIPFQAGIDAGADAVMVGHLILTDADEKPALFSYKLVTRLLREEMGFHGVVITDGLQMQAMTDHYTSAEIAVNAVLAGVDILLCPANLEEAVQALTQAVRSGTVTEERLDESVLRILRLKEKWGIL